ncbi:hypothetical protein SAMN05192562_1079 [Kosakonia arachidis]|uniref:Uncharacterized protein n=1 Tax=Kosakonia arachidis TaxID=551989 RepID=A0A1I7DUX9_9ENTR|nr:hypothetical protein SAMN05192562_1079 [Kosakonia arachidis]
MRIPGYAKRRELELLVKAGLTPLEALSLATNSAALTLGAGHPLCSVIHNAAPQGQKKNSKLDGWVSSTDSCANVS